MGIDAFGSGVFPEITIYDEIGAVSPNDANGIVGAQMNIGMGAQGQLAQKIAESRNCDTAAWRR